MDILSFVRYAESPPTPRAMAIDRINGIYFFSILCTSVKIIRSLTSLYTKEGTILKKEKDKKNIVPLYGTNPIRLGEETSKEAEELGVELAKDWVDENKL